MFQADLLKDLEIDRERVRQIIAKLQADGYITTEKVGNKLKLQYNRGLFNLKGIVENEEGRKIAMKVMVKYISQGYTVTRGKQEGDIRPDLVAFVIDRSTFRPHYDRAIAIEIESPNEVDVHSEQIRKDMQKYILISPLFKEIHIWTSENKFSKLKNIYDSFLQDNIIPNDYKQKVKIFSIKIKEKLEQKPKEEQKVQKETGEFTAQETKAVQSESKPTANTAANNKVGKVPEPFTGELTGKEIDGLMEVEIEGKKYYVKKVGYGKLQQILSTKNYKIEDNKIYTSIGFMKIEVSLISNKCLNLPIIKCPNTFNLIVVIIKYGNRHGRI